MINSNAPYSGLANIMNMRDRNPNTQLAYVPNGYLNSVPTAPNPYTGIPQVNSPIAMNEGGMPSMQYPMQEEAGQLADRGRYGDTTLVHMTPGEVQGLASLGKLTINPDTGLPEAFNLRSLIPMAASVIGGVVAGPAGAAIGSGLGTLATGGSGEQALLGAAMSFGMGYAMQGFGGSIFGDLGAGAATGATTGAASAGTAATGAGAAGIDAAAANSSMLFDPNLPANALTSSGVPLSGLAGQTSAFEAFTPTISSDYIPPSAYEMAAYNQQPAMQTLGGDFVNLDSGPFVPAYKGAGFPATAPSVTPPSSAEMAGYRSGLGDFAPRQDTILEQVTEGVSDVGEGISNIYKDYLSPSRQSIQVTPEKLNEAYVKRATEYGTTVDELPINIKESIRQEMQPGFLKKYGPLGAVGIGGLTLAGAFDEEEPEQQQMAKREVEYPRYTLAGGEERNPETAKEIQSRMLAGGVRPSYFGERRYVRNAAEGGIVGLQQGGMATPQAPSAMSAMLAPPMQQQPMPMQQQPMPMQGMPMQGMPMQGMPMQGMPMQGMPMQGMPMQGMGQPQPQGIQPLPDQSIEFKKNMDMEGQLQQQKSSSDLQGQAALLGLIGGAGNYLQSQGMNYPTTTPSGTRPQAPAMNQGTQVNMGASGGFAQGGLLGYNEGGMPSQEQRYFEGQVVGKGDGQSDEVPFCVDGGEVDMAMLSPDEYVLAADVVSYIGDGSSNAGAAKLDQFMVDVRKQAHGSGKQIEGFQERGLANLVA
jgi:hypothetical protein